MGRRDRLGRDCDENRGAVVTAFKFVAPQLRVPLMPALEDKAAEAAKRMDFEVLMERFEGGCAAAVLADAAQPAEGDKD